MACPFFVPMEKLENGEWLHPHRLPLGCGWSGRCGAPGHEGETPSEEELREFCNLGYAQACSRLPQERPWDSVRFAARISSNKAANGERVQVRYVCEREHLPSRHGMLEFDVAGSNWLTAHTDERVQRLAQSFLSVYLDKKKAAIEPIAS